MKRWKMGIRGKLIAIFVVIKVLPLVVLALLAWGMAQRLGDTVSAKASAMAESMLATVKQVARAPPATRSGRWTTGPGWPSSA